MDLRLSPDPPSVGVARRAVAGLAARCGAAAGDVALCVSEAVTNAVLHAFRGRAGAGGTIHVRAGCPGDGFLHVTVDDDGIGLAPRPDSPGLGLGISLIGRVAESAEVRRRDPGSRVQMRFRAPRTG